MRHNMGSAANSRRRWNKLQLVRVYTKPKGKMPDYTAPVVLRANKCTVEDFVSHHPPAAHAVQVQDASMPVLGALLPTTRVLCCWGPKQPRRMNRLSGTHTYMSTV